MPFCTECGAENPRENKFCSECGKPLQVIEAPEPPAPTIFNEPKEPAPAAEAAPEPPVYTQPQQPKPPAYSASSEPTVQPVMPQTESAAPVAPIPTGGLLAWSIVSLLLCLIPGIVALVQTLGINKCATAEEQAKKASSARLWCIIATALGVIAIIARLVNGG